jgi:hypothetical protein
LFVFSVTCDFFEQFLAKKQTCHYTAITMNDLHPHPTARPKEQRRIARAAGAYNIATERSEPGEEGKDYSGPGGRRNPLKRLDSAKEIQGKPSLFL